MAPTGFATTSSVAVPRPPSAFWPRTGGAQSSARAFQGRFWELHDYLFERQKLLGIADLSADARVQGLEIERFHRDLRSRNAIAPVNDDSDSGVRSWVNGTPTFFIDGTRHESRWDAATLIAALEARSLPAAHHATGLMKPPRILTCPPACRHRIAQGRPLLKS